MNDIINKLIEEREALYDKCAKLSKYLLNSIYGIDTDTKVKNINLMKLQLGAMQNYLYFLDERIELLSKEGGNNP